MFYYKNFYYIYLYFIILLCIFIIEYIYFLPSPTGDESIYLTLSVNICNYNSFFVERIGPEWKHHGFFGQYLFSKINYLCSTKIFYLLNFFVKVFSQILLFLILIKLIKNKENFFLILISALSSQLYTQFRPETFSILIYLIIIFFFINKRFILSGGAFSVLYYTHPTIWFLFSIIFLIFFYKKILINFICLFFGAAIGLITIIFFYEYSFIDYLFAPFRNSGSYNLKYFNIESLLQNYILNKRAIFFIFYFFLIYYFLCKKKKLLIISLPLLIFFGPYSGMHEYNLIALLPFFLILIRVLYKPELKFFKLIYISIIMSILLPYISRNMATIFVHGNNFFTTSNYIKNNIDNLRYLPEFIKYTNPEIKLKFHSQTQNQFFVNDLIQVHAVNGSRHNCKTLSGKSPEIVILGFKIFGSNTSYDVYLCENNKFNKF